MTQKKKKNCDVAFNAIQKERLQGEKAKEIKNLYKLKLIWFAQYNNFNSSQTNKYILAPIILIGLCSLYNIDRDIYTYIYICLIVSELS